MLVEAPDRATLAAGGVDQSLREGWRISKMTDRPETIAHPGEQREMSGDDTMAAWRHDPGTLTDDRGIYFRITPVESRPDLIQSFYLNRSG